MFNDVVESDEEMNPKSVICSEPLNVPIGIDVPGIVIVLPLLIVRSLPSMDNVWESVSLVKYEPVDASIFDNLSLADEVKVFNEVKSLWEPLSIPVPPNIWTDEEIIPLGIDVISVYPTEVK